MFHHEPEENLWYYCPNAYCQPPQEEGEDNIEDKIEDDSASLASTVHLSDGDEDMDYSDGTSGGEH